MRTGFLKDNRGMTMTEVLMAFLVLIIMMGMLSGIIAFSKKMYMNAADLRRSQETVSAVIYSKGFNSVSGNASIPVYRLTPGSDGKYKKKLVENAHFAVGVSQNSVPVISEGTEMSFLVFSSVSQNSVSNDSLGGG